MTRVIVYLTNWKNLNEQYYCNGCLEVINHQTLQIKVTSLLTDLKRLDVLPRVRDYLQAKMSLQDSIDINLEYLSLNVDIFIIVVFASNNRIIQIRNLVDL